MGPARSAFRRARWSRFEQPVDREHETWACALSLRASIRGKRGKAGPRVPTCSGAGSNLTFESREGFPRWARRASLRDGKSLSVSSANIRRRLKALVQDRNAPQKHVRRAEIVLLTADGVGTNEIMRRTGKSGRPVFGAGRNALLRRGSTDCSATRRVSRIKPLGAEAAGRVVALTLGEPPGETTHWTGALMAKAAGLSVSSVQRIWRTHGLQPHRMRQFKLSNDPRFVDKRDVVGLYVDPPAHAIVLSVDEKSQIQALDRTQPGLPLKKGRAKSMTHDYERHGHDDLVRRNEHSRRHGDRPQHAAPSPSGVHPFPQCRRETGSQGKTIHAIVDNYAAHKHPNVRRWLERHPRWTFHFTPTSASWLNAVEGFFATLTKRRLRRGVFRSVADLQAAINRFLEEHNQQPRPFT